MSNKTTSRSTPVRKSEIISVLERAANLLKTKGWCQGEFAMNANYGSVRPTSPRADRYCAIGSVRAATTSRRLRNRTQGILDHIAQNRGFIDMIDMNDRDDTTKRQVLGAFRSARNYVANHGPTIPAPK